MKKKKGGEREGERERRNERGRSNMNSMKAAVLCDFHTCTVQKIIIKSDFVLVNWIGNGYI
jgi:hypothetical protein